MSLLILLGLFIKGLMDEIQDNILNKIANLFYTSK